MMKEDLPGTAMQSSTVEMNVNLDGKEIADEISSEIIPNTLSRKGGTKGENLLVKYALPGFLAELDERVYDLERRPQSQHNGYGVSVGLVVWSLAFLLFPRFVPLPMWLAYVFYAIGFVAWLIGMLGLSIEVFKGKQ